VLPSVGKRLGKPWKKYVKIMENHGTSLEMEVLIWFNGDSDVQIPSLKIHHSIPTSIYRGFPTLSLSKNIWMMSN